MEKNSKPVEMERTGSKDFIIKHSDGSIFECQSSSEKLLNNTKGIKGNARGTLTFMGGIGEKKPLHCDKCKERVYKITCRYNKDINANLNLCEKCLNK
jgi:hypothetical protein